MSPARKHPSGAGAARERAELVRIEADDVLLWGDLALPRSPRGLVVFAHGGGSSRHSPRNRHVAERLRAAGFGTLLFDFLTLREEGRRHGPLSHELLTERLRATTAWALREAETSGLPLGYFGSASGVAAVLASAAARPDVVHAVVCRGGRPDRVADLLEHVVAPTLLVVGELDPVSLAMNQQCAVELGGPWELAIVEGADHLFQEPGALDEVARSAVRWFGRHLRLRPAERHPLTPAMSPP